jgi:hypothetical protein
MKQLTDQQLAGILQRLTRAIVLQQVDINALTVLASGSQQEELDRLRSIEMDRAAPILSAIASERLENFLQAIQALFPNP